MNSLILSILTSLLFLLSLGLGIGLTFSPCYATLCVEDYHPYETRVHVAYFYALIAVCAIALAARAFHEGTRKVSEYHLNTTPLPVFQKRATVGGLALAIWIIGLTFASTAFWLKPLERYWQARGEAVDYTAGVSRLVATSFTGHWCDILAGLVMLPISRGGVLGRVFKVHTSTLLFAHKLLAYGLMLCVLAHMAVYMAWIPTFTNAPGEEQLIAFNIDNPYQSFIESYIRGYWYFVNLPSGGASLSVFIIIAITSLPRIRSKSYNLFYYAHVIFGILFFVFISIHASTDFYLLLPGLSMWIMDWCFRLRWLMRKNVAAEVKDIGEGWFEISIPEWKLPNSKAEIRESPLQTYYLNFPSVSKLQCHAFTAASIGSDGKSPTFVFRKAHGKAQNKLAKEWTWKLAMLAKTQDAELEALRMLPVRLEGPYTPASEGLFLADQVLCIVGGTGITGALSIAEWWLSNPQRNTNERFRLVWTVRTEAMSALKQVKELEKQASYLENFEIIIHISSTSGRLDSGEHLEQFFVKPTQNSDREKTETDDVRRSWVYCSGPEGLLESTSTALLRFDKQLGNKKCGTKERSKSIKQLGWYVAKWDV